jgi:hypothetical protein
MKPFSEGAAEPASVAAVEEWFLRESFERIRDRSRPFESHLREYSKLR